MASSTTSDLETRNGAAQSEPRHTKKEEVRTRYLRDVGMLYGDRGSAVPACGEVGWRLPRGGQRRVLKE